jgi:hypothetical protein
MRTHTLLTRIASMAASLGILCSSSASAFGAGGAGRQTAVRDVELSADGTLVGHVYHADGSAVADQDVELRFKGTAVARTKTSANGQFAVSGARGGAHELTVGETVSPVRLWKNGTAPEGASRGLVVTSDTTVVRGQGYDQCQGYDQYGNPMGATSGLGLIDIVTLSSVALGGAGLYYGIDNNNKLDDLQDEIAKLASP